MSSGFRLPRKNQCFSGGFELKFISEFMLRVHILNLMGYSHMEITNPNERPRGLFTALKYELCFTQTLEVTEV